MLRIGDSVYFRVGEWDYQRPVNGTMTNRCPKSDIPCVYERVAVLSASPTSTDDHLWVTVIKEEMRCQPIGSRGICRRRSMLGEIR